MPATGLLSQVMEVSQTEGLLYDFTVILYIGDFSKKSFFQGLNRRIRELEERVLILGTLGIGSMSDFQLHLQSLTLWLCKPCFAVALRYSCKPQACNEDKLKRLIPMSDRLRQNEGCGELGFPLQATITTFNGSYLGFWDVSSLCGNVNRQMYVVVKHEFQSTVTNFVNLRSSVSFVSERWRLEFLEESDAISTSQHDSTTRRPDMTRLQIPDFFFLTASKWISGAAVDLSVVNSGWPLLLLKMLVTQSLPGSSAMKADTIQRASGSETNAAADHTCTSYCPSWSHNNVHVWWVGRTSGFKQNLGNLDRLHSGTLRARVHELGRGSDFQRIHLFTLCKHGYRCTHPHTHSINLNQSVVWQV